MNQEDEGKMLTNLMNAVFDEIVDTSDPLLSERRAAFAFHMIECKDDIGHLSKLYSEPSKFSVSEARAMIESFLYHASSHIVAAARLGEFFLDSFKDEQGQEVNTR